MDFVFVALDIINQLFTLVFSGIDLSYVSSFRTGIKMVRLVRTARALRMVRVVRESTRARLLLEETIASATLGMALIMILLVVLTFFGLFFMQASADLLLSVAEGSDTNSTDASGEVLETFGSSTESVFSLFALASGGRSWLAIFHSLMEVDIIYGFVFFMFVFFTLVLFLNVVTAVFVDSAIHRSAKNEVENKAVEAEQTKDMLQEADLADKDGNISKEQFLNYLAAPYGKMQLQALGLENAEALGIFDLLDNAGKHTVHISELASGCARFTQPSRSADTISMLLLLRKIVKDQRIAVRSLHERIDALTEALE